MQTLTIRADETLISQIVAISKALADTTNQELVIDDGYADELNARADEALQGLSDLRRRQDNGAKNSRVQSRHRSDQARRA